MPARRRWKIVYGHHPIYSEGAHEDNNTKIEQLPPLLRDRAHIYLAGHDHDMQHLKPEGQLHFFVAVRRRRGSGALSLRAAAGKQLLRYEPCAHASSDATSAVSSASDDEPVASREPKCQLTARSVGEGGGRRSAARPPAPSITGDPTSTGPRSRASQRVRTFPDRPESAPGSDTAASSARCRARRD